MPTPIETTLSTLLPTYTIHNLPLTLISLSTSLLAQSRAKAATLKPEEEIGRTYACCHIACQRLGHKLALEIAPPAPPVKPSVYNKLHTYFNSVLATPRKGERGKVVDKVGDGARANGIEAKGKGERAQVTPVKNATAGAALSTGKRKASTIADGEVEMPAFVGLMIRSLSDRFKTPGAVPHTFAGVQSALRARSTQEPAAKKARTPNRSGSSNNKDQISSNEDSLPALIVTIYIAVVEKLYGPNSGSRDPSFCEDVAQYAEEFCASNLDKLPFKLDELQKIEDEVTRLRRYELKDWMELEWWQNVPRSPSKEDNNDNNETRNGEREASLQDQLDEQLNHSIPLSKTPLRRKEKHGASRLKDGDETVGAAGLLPGLGTMFQPSIDWLSDERRADYAVWKKEILRAGEMEKAKWVRARA